MKKLIILVIVVAAFIIASCGGGKNCPAYSKVENTQAEAKV